MQYFNKSYCKEEELRGNNIINREKNLINMYTSFLSSEKEGSMKLDLYTLLKDEKQILDEFESKSNLT